MLQDLKPGDKIKIKGCSADVECATCLFSCAKQVKPLLKSGYLHGTYIEGVNLCDMRISPDIVISSHRRFMVSVSDKLTKHIQKLKEVHHVQDSQ